MPLPPGSAIPEFKVVDEAVPSHSIWGALMTPCTSTFVRGEGLGGGWGKGLGEG